MPRATWGSPTLVHIAICVPAHDEERLLPGLLRACGALDVGGVSATLCLFLDGCTDRSEAVARDLGGQLPFPVIVASGPRRPDANAGRARRSAMALGAQAVAGRTDALLLSTDADSRPAPDWLQAARLALAAADVVAGRLVGTGGVKDIVQDRVGLYFDRVHAHRRRIDPVPWDPPSGCHCGGGANLGVRAATHAALNGLRPLASGEDAAFLDDAARAGWRVRRDPAMIVRTSSRRVGRAPGGLAASLRALDAHGLPRVPHPAAAAWQYRAQALARSTFPKMASGEAREALGRVLGLSGDHVLGVARDCPNAEAFCMRVVPTAPGGERLVPLAEAEEALAVLERDCCERAA